MGTEPAFLILLFLGVFALLSGRVWTRLCWRSDVSPYGRHTRNLDVMLHPECYATPESVRMIRTMNVAGAVCVAGAVAVLAYELLQITWRK
jgi:hypothetical protein